MWTSWDYLAGHSRRSKKERPLAQMYPAILDPDTKSSAERRLYEAFARELNDAWVVFHHVKWIGNDDRGHPCDGETDFVVAHPRPGRSHLNDDQLRRSA